MATAVVMRLAPLLGASSQDAKNSSKAQHTQYFERQFPRILHTFNGRVGPALRYVVGPSAKHLGLKMEDPGNGLRPHGEDRARRRLELGLGKIKAMAEGKIGLVEVHNDTPVCELAKRVRALRQDEKTPWIINVEPRLNENSEDDLVCKAVEKIEVARVLVVQAWCNEPTTAYSGSALSLARRLGGEIYTAAFFLKPENHDLLAEAIKAESNSQLRRLGVERLSYY